MSRPLLRASLHEAGHCVCALSLELSVVRVWARDDGSGRTEYLGLARGHVRAVVALAGPVAEHLCSVQPAPDYRHGGRGDNAQVDAELAQVDAEHLEHVRWKLEAWAGAILTAHGQAVREIASVLVERGKLNTEDLEPWRDDVWASGWSLRPWESDILEDEDVFTVQRAVQSWHTRPARMTQ